MPPTETDRFTVGVFQDCRWAEQGIEALKRHGFPADALAVIAPDTAEAHALIERCLGVAPDAIDVRGLGRLVTAGPLRAALEAVPGDLGRTGLADSMRRVGFQAHDGYIFEKLASRGGVLVAARSEPLAADALATLHAYGGGNAAIGAWTGRV